MDYEIKGVHYDVSKKTREHIEKKLQKLDYVKENIVDLLFTITKGKKNYSIESKIDFKWGIHAHLKEEAFELFEGIDKFFVKLENKIRKEKEKIQKH